MDDNGTVEIHNPMFLNEEPEPSLIFDSDKVRLASADISPYSIIFKEDKERLSKFMSKSILGFKTSESNLHS
jgi:hypothetical protein